ncbi:MAG: M16 family metallopeptidase [Vibrio sp.]
MSLKKTYASLSIITLALLSVTGCQTTSSNSVTVSADTGKFMLPNYQTVTLKNGLTLKLMPKTDVPLMHVTIATRAGSVNDLTAGTASLTADALLFGTDKYSKQELEQKAAFLGTQIETHASRDHSQVSVDFMAKDAPVMLPLIQQVVLHPSFNEKELTKHKQALVAKLKQDKQSPRSVATRYFISQVFKGGPYGNIENQKTIQSIKVNDVKAFYREHYQPQDTVISVVGDFKPASMIPQLTALFADWKNTRTAASPKAWSRTAPANQPQVLLVNKPDAQITTFAIGGKGVLANNPDMTGIKVVNTVLGGRFTSWLNNALRIDSGLTYGAYSYFTPWKHEGMFTMSSFTQTASTEQAIALAMKTYQRLFKQGIDAATLASAKAYIKGQSPRGYETNQALANFLVKEYICGLSDDDINQFQARVDALTIKDTQKIIQDYFPRNNLQFVLVGNAKKIALIAKKYGHVTQVNIQDVGFGNTQQ